MDQDQDGILDGQGNCPQVSVNDGDHGSGSVGIFIYRTQACFSYLTVVALP